MAQTHAMSRLAVALLGSVLLTGLAGCRRDAETARRDPGTGLSSVVAVRMTGVPAGFPAASLPGQLPADADLASYVHALAGHADAEFDFNLESWNPGAVPAGFQFPLAQGNSDGVRTIAGLESDIVIRWLDPITPNPDGPRFGSNCDYNAYFGDDWNSASNGWTGGPTGVLGQAPQWSGSPDAGYLWTNHEFVSGEMPTTTRAPSQGHRLLALHLRDQGVLTNNVLGNRWRQSDVDTYIGWYKRQIGGSYIRVVRDGSGRWVADVTGTLNRRFDASSATLLRIHGYSPVAAETGDNGTALSAGLLPGTLGNCSGAQTPWGTVLSGEENVRDFYGELEACWNDDQRFVPGRGFDAGGPVSPPFAPDPFADFGRSSQPTQRHRRDGYGWLCELDPERPADESYRSTTTAGDGRGHRKLGVMGRMRHENATFVTGTDWRLVPNRPLVVFLADDRRGGRIFRFVSNASYTPGMTRGEVRALLDDGRLYVAHFADLHNDQGRALGAGVTRGGVTITLAGGDPGVPTLANPGSGVWIELSVGNAAQAAPNAGAPVPAGHSRIAGASLPVLSVAGALLSADYNGIGGLASDDLVRCCAFTACAKLGITELNRPEDVEWNPWGHAGGTGTEPLLYVAFTAHPGRTCCDRHGVLLDPADDHAASARRDDAGGRIWAISHGGADPASATTFTFWEVAAAPATPGSVFDFACPDNLMVDRSGGLWFATDGYAALTGRAESIYYLDTNPSHTVSRGRAFRILSAPAGAEATGPCFTPDQRTLFFSAQHPQATFP